MSNDKTRLTEGQGHRLYKDEPLCRNNLVKICLRNNKSYKTRNSVVEEVAQAGEIFRYSETEAPIAVKGFKVRI